MSPPLFSSPLMVLGRLWLFVVVSLGWPSPRGPPAPRPTLPSTSRRQRGKEPQPFGGLTPQPLCVRCAQSATPPTPPPPVRPDPMPPPHRRPRAIDTARPCCPPTGCASRGWWGLGNLRANGPPSGGPWRPCPWTAGPGSCPEPHGPLFHGQRGSVALIVPVRGGRAEGLGLRGTARGFASDPHTGLSGLRAAADQRRAFAPSFLPALPLRQGQLAEWSAGLRALKASAVSEDEVRERLSRSPPWVWGAVAPESTRLLALDVGDRPRPMAPRLVHQVAQVLAPDCAPLCLPDGVRESLRALLTHEGQWVPPPRWQAPGPAPQPRWRPRPQ